MKTDLLGFSRTDSYQRGDDLTGFFTHRGQDMIDFEIRAMVEYGIAHGYQCDSDIPEWIIDNIISYNRTKENVVQLKLF